MREAFYTCLRSVSAANPLSSPSDLPPLLLPAPPQAPISSGFTQAGAARGSQGGRFASLKTLVDPVVFHARASEAMVGFLKEGRMDKVRGKFIGRLMFSWDPLKGLESIELLEILALCGLLGTRDFLLHISFASRPHQIRTFRFSFHTQSLFLGCGCIY